MKKDKADNPYFMDKVLPEFIRFFFSALLLMVAAWIAKSPTSKEPSSIPFSFGINQNLAILIYIIVFLYTAKYTFISIRKLIIAKNDAKQSDYNPQFDIEAFDEHAELIQLSRTETVETFNYRVRYYSYTILGSEQEFVTDISNPKCGNKNCLTELIEHKTFFGSYSFFCPACKKKYKSKYSTSTLKRHTFLVLSSQYTLQNERSLNDHLPF